MWKRAARGAVPAGDGKEELKIAVGCACADCGGVPVKDAAASCFAVTRCARGRPRRGRQGRIEKRRGIRLCGLRRCAASLRLPRVCGGARGILSRWAASLRLPRSAERTSISSRAFSFFLPIPKGMGQRSAERVRGAAVCGGTPMGTPLPVALRGRAARWAVPAGDGKEGLKNAVGGVCAGCGVLRHRCARRVCVAVARAAICSVGRRRFARRTRCARGRPRRGRQGRFGKQLGQLIERFASLGGVAALAAWRVAARGAVPAGDGQEDLENSWDSCLSDLQRRAASLRLPRVRGGARGNLQRRAATLRLPDALRAGPSPLGTARKDWKAPWEALVRVAAFCGVASLAACAWQCARQFAVPGGVALLAACAWRRARGNLQCRAASLCSPRDGGGPCGKRRAVSFFFCGGLDFLLAGVLTISGAAVILTKVSEC